LRLETWLPIYKRICDDFGFSMEEDLKAARSLADLIEDRGEMTLEGIRSGFPKSVLICGGGPRLSEELSSISVERYVVVADSATSVLLDAGIAANMIVTDLDGVVEDQVEMNRGGTKVFVHAHGDNQPAVMKYFRHFVGPLVGTCQCEPPMGLVNFGGFTDGDRAACICAELGAETLSLAGFDFRNPAEKSGRSPEVKARKLGWAEKILHRLASDGVKILDASTEREIF